MLSEDHYVLKEPHDQAKLVVYQVLTRLFGNKNKTNKIFGTIEENGVGKFADINDLALSEIAALGVTHIWYTGIIEHAVLTDYREYGISFDDADIVKGRAGSPYAIKDYYDVNPDLSVDVDNRMTEFEDLVNRTHRHGMKVIIDFVANHVSRQYHSDRLPPDAIDLGQNDDTEVRFSAQNNFYYLPGQNFSIPEGYESLGSPLPPTKNGQFNETPARVTGNDFFSSQPTINDWFDTVKLNYGVDYEHDRKKYFDPIPPTWQQMKDILLFWATKGIDGFRCDMAEMVPVEFWEWAIPQVKQKYGDILFIAEIYNPKAYHDYLYQGQFDYLYDKVQLYDTIRQMIEGRGSAQHITQVWQDLKEINHKMLRFLENHDEQRIASDFFAGKAEKGKPGMTVAALMYTGPVMVFFGQEVGERSMGVSGFGQDDGRTTIYDYWGLDAHQQWMNEGKFDGGNLSREQKELRSFYSKLLHIASSNEVIRNGVLIDLNAYNSTANINENTYSFIRFNDDQMLLILTNFSEERVEIEMEIPQNVNGSTMLQDPGQVASDLLSNKRSIRLITSGNTLALHMTLDPLASHIFNFSR